MENRKWLKRKYPENYKEINKFFDDTNLVFFKLGKFKMGRLTTTIVDGEIYTKGTLCIFKRSNPINDYNYPLHTIVVKCIDTNTTQSGYHTIWVTPNQCEEIIN
jgi:hypothetical protein